MAEQTTQTPKECPRKLALMDDIKSIAQEIFEIHNREIEDVLRGDFSSGAETQERLREARERKVLIIERYREHVESHGC